MILERLFRKGMSCGEVLEVLQTYLDGETDEQTARQIVIHLGHCKPCDHESIVYQRIKVSLAGRARTIDPGILEALALYGQQLTDGEIDSDDAPA